MGMNGERNNTVVENFYVAHTTVLLINVPYPYIHLSIFSFGCCFCCCHTIGSLVFLHDSLESYRTPCSVTPTSVFQVRWWNGNSKTSDVDRTFQNSDPSGIWCPSLDSRNTTNCVKIMKHQHNMEEYCTRPTNNPWHPPRAMSILVDSLEYNCSHIDIGNRYSMYNNNVHSIVVVVVVVPPDPIKHN